MVEKTEIYRVLITGFQFYGTSPCLIICEISPSVLPHQSGHFNIIVTSYVGIPRFEQSPNECG